jgi:hypothetical protein
MKIDWPVALCMNAGAVRLYTKGAVALVHEDGKVADPPREPTADEALEVLRACRDMRRFALHILNELDAVERALGDA